MGQKLRDFIDQLDGDEEDRVIAALRKRAHKWPMTLREEIAAGHVEQQPSRSMSEDEANRHAAHADALAALEAARLKWSKATAAVDKARRPWGPDAVAPPLTDKQMQEIERLEALVEDAEDHYREVAELEVKARPHQPARRQRRAAYGGLFGRMLNPQNGAIDERIMNTAAGATIRARSDGGYATFTTAESQAMVEIGRNGAMNNADPVADALKALRGGGDDEPLDEATKDKLRRIAVANQRRMIQSAARNFHWYMEVEVEKERREHAAWRMSIYANFFRHAEPEVRFMRELEPDEAERRLLNGEVDSMYKHGNSVNGMTTHKKGRGFVLLRADLDDDDFNRTTAHEAFHVWQFERGDEPECERWEQEATDFAANPPFDELLAAADRVSAEIEAGWSR